MTLDRPSEKVADSAPRPSPRVATAGDPPNAERRWTAEIVWDRAAGAPAFRAVAQGDGESGQEVVAESRPVEWPPSGNSAVADMRAAVDELEATLLRAGWSAHEPGRAWYARRFVWKPEPGPTAPSSPTKHVAPEHDPRGAATQPWPTLAPVQPTPMDFAQGWRCEICWRSGYVNSSFVAVRFAPGERRGSEIAASSKFRWMLKNDPDPKISTDRAAVRRMCDALIASGWRPAGRGVAWYAERFVWPRDGEPPDQLDPATAAELDDDARWRCEIAWRAGVTRPRFVALMSEPRRHRRRRIASSAPLKASLLRDPDPRLRDHEAAVAKLAAALIGDGWEPVARHGPWYARRFVWRQDTPPPLGGRTTANRQPRVAARPAKSAR